MRGLTRRRRRRRRIMARSMGRKGRRAIWCGSVGRVAMWARRWLDGGAAAAGARGSAFAAPGSTSAVLGVFPFAGAVLLVVAGGLKLLAVAEAGYVVVPIVGAVAAPGATALALLEVVAGVGLVCGMQTRTRGWLVGCGLLYLGYAVVAWASVLLGQHGCGCFVVVDLPVGLQGTLDVVIGAGSLAAWSSVRPVSRWWLWVGIVTVWGWVGVGLVRLMGVPGAIAENLVGSRQQVRLGALEGKLFPGRLFVALRGSVEEIGEGEWVVVAGSVQCPVCKGWLEERRRGGLGGGKVAFCVVDGLSAGGVEADVEVVLCPREEVVVTGQLPAVLRLRDGFVEKVAQELSHLVGGASNLSVAQAIRE
jgi:hypothetical protein